MRISTAYFYQSQVRTLSEQQSRLWEIQKDIASGVRVEVAREDPMAVARRDRLDAQWSRLNVFSGIQVQVEMRWKEEEQEYAQLADIAQRTVETLDRWMHPIRSRDERLMIAQEMRGLKEEMIRLSLSQNEQQEYVFGGVQTQDPPFVKTPSGWVYQGSTLSLSVQVDSQERVVLRAPGQDIFEQVSTVSGNTMNVLNRWEAMEVGLFNATSSLSGAQVQQIEDWRRDVEHWQRAWIDDRAQVGLKMNRLDALKEEQASKKVWMQEERSRWVDTDLNGAVVALKQAEQAFEANALSFKRLQGLSLFNYLR